MIVTIHGNGDDTQALMLDEAFKLRHRVFVEEMGWEDVRRRDGRERDQFDDERAIHFLLYEHGNLVGYQRLLPTTRPYLMSEVYPQLCDDDIPNDPQVYEWSRLAIDARWRGDDKMGRPALLMVRAMVDWCIRSDVHTVLVATSPIMMLKFVQCHFRIAPIGLLQPLDGNDVIALAARLDTRSLIRLDQLLSAAHPLQQTA